MAQAWKGFGGFGPEPLPSLFPPRSPPRPPSGVWQEQKQAEPKKTVGAKSDRNVTGWCPYSHRITGLLEAVIRANHRITAPDR